MKRLESDGASFAKTLERYEGMLVKLVEDMDDAKEGNQSMHVARAFNFDFELLDKKQYRNNMVLAYERPNFHPNQDHVAGSFESLMQLNQNEIVLCLSTVRLRQRTVRSLIIQRLIATHRKTIFALTIRSKTLKVS